MSDADNQDKLSVIPWIVLLVIVVIGFFFYKARQDEKTKTAQLEKVMMEKKEQEKKAMEEKARNTAAVILSEQNKSGQSGSATVTKDGDKVKVVLSLTGGKFTEPQPVHFHEGICEKPGKVVYPLTDLEEGKSETTLNVSLEKLKSQAPLIVNAHQSKEKLSVYTACGVFQ